MKSITSLFSYDISYSKEQVLLGALSGNCRWVRVGGIRVYPSSYENSINKGFFGYLQKWKAQYLERACSVATLMQCLEQHCSTESCVQDMYMI